jgi:hypothetical protein
MYLDRLLSRVHHYHLFIEGDGNAGAGGDTGAAAAAGGEAAAGGAAGAGSAGDAGTGGGLSELAKGTVAGEVEAGTPSWPDEWRSLMTGGDEAGLKLAEKYADPAAIWQKLMNQEQVIRRGAHKVAPTLPENATEEQVAEYRKALGVPETPDGYELKFAEDLKPTEADNEMLNGFLADMHRQNIPPGPAKAAFDWYQAQVKRAGEEQAASQQRQRHTNELTLRKEYGADYMRNLGLADEFLDAYPGLKAIVHPGSSVELLRDVVALARASSDEEALYGGDTGAGGKSVDTEYQELIQKSATGKITKTEEARLTTLAEARVAREARQGRSRAA